MERVTIEEGRPISGEGLFARGQQPFELGGALFFPAHFVNTGRINRADDELVQLALAARTILGNTVGVFLRMTPEGARELAGHLIAEAQKVDNHVAAQAAAAIEAARKGGAA